MSVTLKELRISKGLNQAQCAEYLGMSTRNYQNYETMPQKQTRPDTMRFIKSWKAMVGLLSRPPYSRKCLSFIRMLSRVRACGR